METVGIGASVYLWDRTGQSRFAVDVLAPLVQELAAAGIDPLIWFDRFDARGPHVFAILAVDGRHAGHAEELLERWTSTFLEGRQGDACLVPETLERLHAACRGKELCEPDREPGIAEQNSFRMFGHPLDDYPFHLTGGLAAGRPVWRCVHRLTLWAIARLAENPSKARAEAAIRWLSSLDHRLSEAGQGERYWHFHLTTLMPKLDELVENVGPALLTDMEKRVGEANREIFDRIWCAPEKGAYLAVQHDLMQELGALPESRRWPVLREINHVLLKQLALVVPLQLPLVLFFWLKDALPRHGSSGGGARFRATRQRV